MVVYNVKKFSIFGFFNNNILFNVNRWYDNLDNLE